MNHNRAKYIEISMNIFLSCVTELLPHEQWVSLPPNDRETTASNRSLL